MQSWHFWIALTALSGAIAFIAIQAYTSFFPMIELLMLAVLLHVVVVYGYTKSLSEDKSGILYAISNIMAVLFVVVISKCIFGNHVSNKQIVGLILGIGAIFLLGMSD
mgnify:CR=1 FL=1